MLHHSLLFYIQPPHSTTHHTYSIRIASFTARLVVYSHHCKWGIPYRFFPHLQVRRCILSKYPLSNIVSSPTCSGIILSLPA